MCFSYDYPDNCTCLQAAIEGGRHKVVAELLRCRADPNVWNPVLKTSLLHLAVQVSEWTALYGRLMCRC